MRAFSIVDNSTLGIFMQKRCFSQEPFKEKMLLYEVFKAS